MENYHDNHYAEMKVQPLEVMQEMLNISEFAAFLMGNVVKYHLRAGHKQGEAISKDIDKRDRYLSWLYYLWNDGLYINPKLDYELDEEFKNMVLNKIDKTYAELLSKKSKD